MYYIGEEDLLRPYGPSKLKQIDMRQISRRKSNLISIYMRNPHRHEIPQTVRQHEVYMSKGEGSCVRTQRGETSLAKS